MGIETSCDETAAAVVEMRGSLELKVLSNVVASQTDLHRPYGGVVPEVAARSHLEIILDLTDKALVSAKCDWAQIDGIAVTHGPGLLGALLIGVSTAKTLAVVKAKPLVGVDHVHAHIYGAWLDKSVAKQPRFPLLGMIVSGGHTQLVLFKSHLDYKLLGQTQDDAVGEAFDKVAKMLGLGFPGGPALAKAAETGDANTYHLPIPHLTSPYDFSFSGLKTAVLRQLQNLAGKDFNFPSTQIARLLKPQIVADMAAAFQAKANDILVTKTALAAKEFKPNSIVVAGGVAANTDLRYRLTQAFGLKVIFPPLELCTDNAAMVAGLGCIKLKAGLVDKPLELETLPSLSM